MQMQVADILAKSFINMCREKLDHAHLVSIKGYVEIITDNSQPLFVNIEHAESTKYESENEPQNGDLTEFCPLEMSVDVLDTVIKQEPDDQCGGHDKMWTTNDSIQDKMWTKNDMGSSQCHDKMWTDRTQDFDSVMECTTVKSGSEELSEGMAEKKIEPIYEDGTVPRQHVSPAGVEQLQQEEHKDIILHPSEIPGNETGCRSENIGIKLLAVTTAPGDYDTVDDSRPRKGTNPLLKSEDKKFIDESMRHIQNKTLTLKKADIDGYSSTSMPPTGLQKNLQFAMDESTIKPEHPLLEEASNDGHNMITEQGDSHGNMETTLGVMHKSVDTKTGMPMDAVACTVTSSHLPETDSDKELRNDGNLMRSKSTVGQTDRYSKRFCEWLLLSKNESRQLQAIPASSLDQYVGDYLMEIKKDNGEEYEPDSLTSIHRCINRKLEELGYQYSLITSPEFARSKSALQARRRKLKQLGKGNRPFKADALTEAEEEKLWEVGQLGYSTPVSLINTVWYYNTKLFGLKSVHQSRQLKWGDILLVSDENGQKWLQFNEKETKTQTGNNTHLGPFQRKIFRNVSNPNRCPVRAFELYSKKRPRDMHAPNSPFYLAINPKAAAESSPWFKCSAMGHIRITQFMCKMAKAAGLGGRKTNISVSRKTSNCVKRTLVQHILPSGLGNTVTTQLEW